MYEGMLGIILYHPLSLVVLGTRIALAEAEQTSLRYWSRLGQLEVVVDGWSCFPSSNMTVAPRMEVLLTQGL